MVLQLHFRRLIFKLLWYSTNGATDYNTEGDIIDQRLKEWRTKNRKYETNYIRRLVPESSC